MCNPSLGGSTMTRSSSSRSSCSWGWWRTSCSAFPAKKWDCAATPLIWAFLCASTIASSTISIPTRRDHHHDFSAQIPIVPLPQYRSSIVPFTFPTIWRAVENNISAPVVLVWKKEKGETWKLSTWSKRCNSSKIRPSHRIVFTSTSGWCTVSARPLFSITTKVVSKERRRLFCSHSVSSSCRLRASSSWSTNQREAILSMTIVCWVWCVDLITICLHNQWCCFTLYIGSQLASNDSFKKAYTSCIRSETRKHWSISTIWAKRPCWWNQMVVYSSYSPFATLLLPSSSWYARKVPHENSILFLYWSTWGEGSTGGRVSAWQAGTFLKLSITIVCFSSSWFA